MGKGHKQFRLSRVALELDIWGYSLGFLLLILATHVNAWLAFSPKANTERNRLAANLAILDVLLVPRGRVDRNLQQLPTVGATDVSGFRRIHSARTRIEKDLVFYPVFSKLF